MRKFSALLIYVLILFPALMAMLLLAAVNTWVFDRAFYQQVLTSQEFEVVVREGLVDALLTTDALGNRTRTELPLSADQLRELVDAAALVIPDGYIASQTAPVIDAVFDMFEGRTRAVDVQLDVSAVKANIAGEPGERFAEALAGILPVCTGSEPARGASVPLCRPENLPVAEFLPTVRAAVRDAGAAIPDDLVIIDMADSGFTSTSPFSTVSEALTATVICFALFVFGLLLINAFIWSKLPRGRMQWIAFMLVIPGALVLALGLTMTAAPTITRDLTTSVFVVTSALPTLLTSVTRVVAEGFLYSGGITLAIAVILFVMSFALRGTPRDELLV